MQCKLPWNRSIAKDCEMLEFFDRSKTDASFSGMRHLGLGENMAFGWVSPSKIPWPDKSSVFHIRDHEILDFPHRKPQFLPYPGSPHVVKRQLKIRVYLYELPFAVGILMETTECF